jgi:adenylate cyclase
MFITIIFIYFFSKTLSHPILRLKKASEDIEKGNFNIALKPRGHDEITVLTQSMNKMAEGLGQKERLKKMFERFTNKAVAQKALTGELKLGGETKTATVFFSDIRGFTAMSESMSPEEVISFLNDYMTRMVACVVKTGGIVDKFIGDSVMAVWGAPFTSGNPAEDALNAVKAALLMRSSLIVFNKERVLLNQPPVKIGCGINTGSVVAGQMGSQKHKIEYTVLGDTVNFASRTEALNKPLGTDILITENTYNLIKEHLIAEEMPAVSVKGKTGLCRMFAVINIKDCTDIPGAGKHGPKTLSQIRQKLGIKEPDFSKININEEEHKYKIQGQ